jgi:hypothetical protein
VRKWKEEGRRKKEEVIIATVSVINNVLIILEIAMSAFFNLKSKIQNPKSIDRSGC